jgi:hypothetical protein
MGKIKVREEEDGVKRKVDGLLGGRGEGGKLSRDRE